MSPHACRQLWQIFQSVKQHFTSQASQSDTPAHLVADSDNDASHSQAGVEAAELSAKQSAIAAKSPEVTRQQAAEISKHLHEQLQKQMSGKSSGDVTGHARDPVPDSTQHAGVEQSPLSNSAPAQHASTGGIGMCSFDSRNSAASKAKPDALFRNEGQHRPDALQARVCPAYGHPGSNVLSLCHLTDLWPSHSCTSEQDCGVDSSSCRPRVCSLHGFCQAG